MTLGVSLLVASFALGDAKLDPLILAKMDSAIEQAIEQKKLPGGVLWFEHKDETYTKSFGQRAVEPTAEKMTADTVFDAASLTKVIATTTCVMKLIEEGKLSLEDKVQTLIPELTGDENKARITVRNLMTHTSGLFPIVRRGYDYSGYANGIALACGEASSGLANAGYRYSDINYILLGDIVRRVSGQTLDRFAKQHVFEPLKMVDSGFTPGAGLLPRIAPTERGVPRGVVHDPTARAMDGVAGHAGLFTTAADLTRFAKMLLNGGELEGVRILKKETVKLMTSVQSPPNITARRGLGWDIDSPYSTSPRGAFPRGSFGHTGWTGTSFWVDPFSQSFLIFLSNRNHPTEAGSVKSLRHELATLAVEAITDIDFENVSGALPELTKSQRAEWNAKLLRKRGEVKNGIDVLAGNGFKQLDGLRVGLITNHTGIARDRKTTIDLLHKAPNVTLVKLFSPEHGIRGTADEKVGDSVDRKTGLKIHSLYGESRKPSTESLKDIDALVFDIQDIGCRFYTYISTMGNCMEAAQAAGLKFVVLDRVNPIGGDIVEGPVLAGERSFVGFHEIPVRHGMTVGELATMFKAERFRDVDLTVVKIEGWKRSQQFGATGLPWVNPSPNIRNLTEAIVYPGVGLLEFTNLSVGRGTVMPFELVGAPYINAEKFAAELKAAQLPGLDFVPIHFTPKKSKFVGEKCGGVRILLKDRKAKTVDIGITMALALRKNHRADWQTANLNKLLVHPLTRDALIAGKGHLDIRKGWESGTRNFLKRRKALLLY
jgi:uncharacterized protein YbbC (DUF1343 family)/CubicO group peptidase (beta-lactamase class C family)